MPLSILRLLLHCAARRYSFAYLTLIHRSPRHHSYGVLRSKAIGEPPLSLGCAPFFAARAAVAAALSDAGVSGYFPMNSPGTGEMLQTTANPVPTQFVLSSP